MAWPANGELYLMDLGTNDVPALGAGGVSVLTVANMTVGLIRMRRRP